MAKAGGGEYHASRDVARMQCNGACVGVGVLWEGTRLTVYHHVDMLEAVWTADNVNNVWQHQCFSLLILLRGRVWTGLLPTAGWLDRKGDGICTVLVYMYMPVTVHVIP